MSVSGIAVVMDRIASATPQSPIAVFRSSAAGKLDAVFAQTVVTQSRIRAGDADLIGVFDKTMNRDDVRSELLKHIAD